MAWVTEKQLKDGRTSYRVQWRQGGRGTPPESLTFEDSPTAERCRKLVEAHRGRIDPEEAWRQIHGVPEPQAAEPKATTLGAWADLWFPKKTGVQDGVLEKYLKNYEDHIAPVVIEGRRLAEYPLGEITPMVLRSWVAVIERRMKAPTCHRVHAVLHQLFRDAAREGLIAQNPAAYTELPRIDRDEDEDPKTFLTHQEAQMLLACMPNELGRDVTTALLGTGLRWGELTALQTGDFDALASPPTVTVRRAWKKSKAKGWYTGPPKSRRSRRTITVSREVAEILIARADLSDEKALIFTNHKGKRVDNSNFRRDCWNPAVRIAQAGRDLKGRPYPVIGEWLRKSPTPHDLRHSHASWLIAANINIVRVSRRLGHESVAFTERIYVHLLGDGDADLLAGVDRGLRPPEVSAPSSRDGVGATS